MVLLPGGGSSIRALSGDGGTTDYGANCFAMVIVGSLMVYFFCEGSPGALQLIHRAES